MEKIKMKKTLSFMIMIIIASAVIAGNSGVENTVTKSHQPNGRDNGLQAAIITTVDSVITVLDTVSPVSQSDTNVTTVATSYTPVNVGQLLIGLAGTGTNAIWIAKGTTTNDWVQVAP